MPTGRNAGTHMAEERVVCRELLAADDPLLESVRPLYESTLELDERIPWKWVKGAVARRVRWRPGDWSPHLLAATPAARHSELLGYCYGIHVPDFGGYLT